MAESPTDALKTLSNKARGNKKTAAQEITDQANQYLTEALYEQYGRTGMRFTGADTMDPTQLEDRRTISGKRGRRPLPPQPGPPSARKGYRS